MSALWLFVFHIGFVVGGLLLSLIIGTLVIYLRKESSFANIDEVRHLRPTADFPAKRDVVIRHAPEEQLVVSNASPPDESEEIGAIFPLRQPAGESRHIFTPSLPV